jgi:hypothetical protein
MRALFTIHAGEYLVASFIEKNFPLCRVWIPSKDTGIDLLVTDSKCAKSTALQVKFSKDYMPTHMTDYYKHKLKVCTWFQFTSEALEFSSATYWVFVLQSYAFAKAQYLIIPPSTLFTSIRKYHGRKKTYDLYFWVNSQNRCWETRSLLEAEKRKTVDDSLQIPDRDFTRYLDRWTPIKRINS